MLKISAFKGFSLALKETGKHSHVSQLSFNNDLVVATKALLVC